MISNSKIFKHADDYGLTNGVSKSLDELIEKGKINSVSVLVNGYDDLEFKIKTDTRIACHINIFENKPVLEAQKLFIIVDNDGKFRESFIFYLIKYYFSSNKKRQKIKKQIYLEVEMQLLKLKEIIGPSHKIASLDSHNHIHMIPYIFDIFVEIAKKYDIENIRTTRELFDFKFKKENLLIFNFYVGLIKHLLLNFFALINCRKLVDNNLTTNKYFLGVLFSGKMTKEIVISSMNKINKYLKNNEHVEIVLHPGLIEVQELKYWKKSPSLAKFYSSKNRLKENLTMKSLDD